mgnify:CR=1 FL=1
MKLQVHFIGQKQVRIQTCPTHCTPDSTVQYSTASNIQQWCGRHCVARHRTAAALHRTKAGVNLHLLHTSQHSAKQCRTVTFTNVLQPESMRPAGYGSRGCHPATVPTRELRGGSQI